MVVSTGAAIKLWKKDQEEGNATRTEVGKAIANYGRKVIDFVKKK